MGNSSTLRRYNNYLSIILGGRDDVSLFDFADKDRCVNQHITYMLNRTQSMFKWSGLPDTVPQRSLELFLQCNGHVCWAIVNDELYVFTGGLGGKPDAYYMPTEYVVSNPGLNYNKVLRIDADCVVMANDSMYYGLLPMFSRYSSGLTEVELSLRNATVNTRATSIISASDDATKESALEYIRNIEDGKLGVIGENAFFDGVKIQPYSSSGYGDTLTDLIELEQYWKASWYNDLGLNANYNMKRESLNSEESQLNNDALLPLVDDMLRQRRIAIEKVNEMFNTDITVDYDSSWEDNMEEIDLEHEKMSAESTDSEEELNYDDEVD